MPSKMSSTANTRVSIGRARAAPSARATASKVTKRKQQIKKNPPVGSLRDFPCRPCVTRATKAPGHECASQNNTGAACWDCAKNGHTCKPVPHGAVAAVRTFWLLNRQIKETDGDPDDAWRAAAQRAAQELRAYSVAPHVPALPPALAAASHGDDSERNYMERKILALETIAEAARLWIPDSEDEIVGDGEEAGEEDD
ncbi:hypothetical protein JDV02_003157 [Purpureocillium takamizusanense]|uniref:Uncharacterized protein n=1 Tax=Purpureocillium takamizusanense TaxID=2060973 RepID=A0A9Q8QA39_9HYPO|nr:uncharacterized protein JDV02_003157 [Purpureocillium takamizusanense]UNI16749.1 hypothetical protein JDV02_003157 [Purpureocillium takamizusanense]